MQKKYVKKWPLGNKNPFNFHVKVSSKKNLFIKY